MATWVRSWFPTERLGTSTNKRCGVLPAAGERREGDGLKLLVLGGGQAVFDGLFQLLFTFVRAPLGDVTMDDKFGCESTGLADGSWDTGKGKAGGYFLSSPLKAG